MSLRKNSEDTKLAKEILQYFLRNPQAADNLVGVAQWRLMDETVRQTIESTSFALEWLVSKGFLYKSIRVGADPIYGIEEKGRSEAEQFLGRTVRPHRSRQ